GKECNPEGERYPSMVVEIGVSQSLPSLCRAARQYFSQRTSIQVYLAIKIFKMVNGTRPMVALRFLRTNQNRTRPDIVKSFGTAPLNNMTKNFLRIKKSVPAAAITGVGMGGPACNGPGIALYQMAFPPALVFNGDPAGVPALVAGC